jgi:hypothetical protein
VGEVLRGVLLRLGVVISVVGDPVGGWGLVRLTQGPGIQQAMVVERLV